MFDPELSIGDLLTAIAVLVSATGILAELRKDRLLKRKELADRVRRSAGLIVAKADRWKQLSLGLFDDLQPIITDADMLLVKDQDVVKVRDFFWRELFALQANTAKRIMDEQIEGAYADLYGYDPRIQDLFTDVIGRLRQIDALIFNAVVQQTQEDILSLKRLATPLSAALLGNLVRTTISALASRSQELMEETFGSFRAEMGKLVRASDEAIEARQFTIGSSVEVLPELLEELLLPSRPTTLQLAERRCAFKVDYVAPRYLGPKPWWLRPGGV